MYVVNKCMKKNFFFLLLAISTKCGKNKDKKNYGRFKNNNNNRTTHQQYIQCDDDEELAVFKVFFFVNLLLIQIYLKTQTQEKKQYH